MVHRQSGDSLLNGRHFCILPWIHFSLGPTGDVKPCCRSTGAYSFGNTRDQSIEKIWEDEPARRMRLELLGDRPVPQCKDCYHLEEIGAPSMRQDVNRRFASAIGRVDETREDGSVPKRPFLYLDLRFSNLCNFKCRSCTSTFSTSWAEDERKLGRVPAERSVAIEDPRAMQELLETNLPFLERVYFAGGEPLLDEQHYRLLEMLIAAGRTDVELIYNTNFSKLAYRNWNALELWSRFRVVALSASLDGAGAQAEFLRKGLDWERTVENFRKLREAAPHVSFEVYPTISAMNVFHLTDAIREWARIGMLRDDAAFTVNVLREPTHLHINILSLEERARLRNHYADFLRAFQKESSASLHQSVERGLRQILDSFSASVSMEDRRRFAFMTMRLDAIRGEDFGRLFPQLAELVQLA